MTGKVLDSIIGHIHAADVVLADITDRNANVFYELGIRHCLRKGTIIVSQPGHDLPSDLRGLWYTQYGLRPKEVSAFKDAIGRLLKIIEDDPERSDNPVSDYLERERSSISQFVLRDNIKKLGALFIEATGNYVLLNSGPPDEIRTRLISYGCLDLLLETLYVDPGPETLAFAYELRSMLKRLQAGDSNVDLLASATGRSSTMASIATNLRESISRGVYAEPSTVSVMMWLPPQVDTNLFVYFSRAKPVQDLAGLYLTDAIGPNSIQNELKCGSLELLCVCGSGRSFAACTCWWRDLSQNRTHEANR